MSSEEVMVVDNDNATVVESVEAMEMEEAQSTDTPTKFGVEPVTHVLATSKQSIGSSGSTPTGKHSSTITSTSSSGNPMCSSSEVTVIQVTESCVSLQSNSLLAENISIAKEEPHGNSKLEVMATDQGEVLSGPSNENTPKVTHLDVSDELSLTIATILNNGLIQTNKTFDEILNQVDSQDLSFISKTVLAKNDQDLDASDPDSTTEPHEVSNEVYVSNQFAKCYKELQQTMHIGQTFESLKVDLINNIGYFCNQLEIKKNILKKKINEIERSQLD